MNHTDMKRMNFPFTAIVGQEDMKRALLLNLINPQIGGVLIRGEKGTAKSTAVRSLADVLGLRLEVEGCPFSCDPNQPAHWCRECRQRKDHPPVSGRMRVVDLPVSATEDRLVGSLDIEQAIRRGEKQFEPGILAQANRNILYVDEVNLLDDHLVDTLLDAAAMGVNTIEREGVSYSHPSRFLLVGTMNPEEGDLRPQLIDRFGLVVDVFGEDDIRQRMEVVRRRLAFEENPECFVHAFSDQQSALREQIRQAQNRLPEVSYNETDLEIASYIAITLEVDGHRADITMIKTALANAAFSGRSQVELEDLIVAANLALPHRLRRRPFEEGRINPQEIEEMIQNYAGL